MRKTTVNDITIYHPNALSFAFNACICRAVRSGGTIAYTKTMCAGLTMRIKAYEEATWDIREMLQLAIRDKVKSGTTDWTVLYTIEVYGDGDVKLASITGESFVVWGALRRGETYNRGRRMAYFNGWPFDFGVYLNGTAGKIMVSNDGRPDGLINLTQAQGIFKYSLPSSPHPAVYKYELYDFVGTMTQVTFDNSFDLTFRYRFNGTFTKIMDIDVFDVHYEHPVYLRWIDRHGFTVYWLFKQGDEQREVKAEGEFIRNNMAEIDAASIQGDVNDRLKYYARTDTMELCAPLVDRVQFDVLQDIASSPSVDMYDKASGQWQAVTVKAGTYTKTADELQDFVVMVTMPEVQLQRL